MNKKSSKKLYVISGSSGVGKGSLIKKFLTRNPDFVLSISCTTRNPRFGEVDGVNYFFLTKEDFKNCIENEKFLEWAEYAGNFYGTKKKYIQQCLDDGKSIILEIETKGALQIKKQMPEAVLIFVTPPSYDVLESRLRGRCTEDEAAIQKRLNKVKAELKAAEQYDYRLVNDNIDDAVLELEKIITGEQAKC